MLISNGTAFKHICHHVLHKKHHEWQHLAQPTFPTIDWKNILEVISWIKYCAVRCGTETTGCCVPAASFHSNTVHTLSSCATRTSEIHERFGECLLPWQPADYTDVLSTREGETAKNLGVHAPHDWNLMQAGSKVIRDAQLYVLFVCLAKWWGVRHSTCTLSKDTHNNFLRCTKLKFLFELRNDHSGHHCKTHNRFCCLTW